MVGFWGLIFFISLAVLAKAADYFIDASEKIGLALGISPFFIGVSIIAFGTSLPELLTSLMAVAHHAPQMVMGDIIGSNIANILLVAGVAAVAAGKIKIDRDILRLDLPLLALTTAALLVMSFWDKRITLSEGIIALAFYGIYFIYLLRSRQDTLVEEIEKKLTGAKEKVKRPPLKLFLFFVLFLSGAGLFLGAKFTVVSALKLSALLGISSSLIALTAIAIGTSLPELAVTLRAARQGKGDLAIGNVFGSNIFNGTVIVGLSSFFCPLPIGPLVFSVALPFLALATILYTFSGMSHRIYNYEGAMFVLLYILFLAKLFHIF